MIRYTIEIELSDDQEAAMQMIAVKAGKSLEQIFDQLAEEHILGQIKQWILDEIKGEIEKIDPGDALKRLRVPIV